MNDLLDTVRPTWYDYAACRGLDPAMFFPERGETVRTAKAVCATCPVAATCLEYALAEGEQAGVWGNTCERERRRIRKARRLPVAS